MSRLIRAATFRAATVRERLLSATLALSSARRAVTLLEMILATSLLVLLSSLTYMFYSTSLSARDAGMKHAQRLRLARVVLDRITTELRQAPTSTRDFGVGLVGDPEALVLTTRRVPRRELARPYAWSDEVPEAEYDLVQVQYRIARHPDLLHDDGYEAPLGLARVESRVPRPESPLAKASAGEEGAEPGGEEEEQEEPQVPLDESFFEELFSGENAEGGDASLEADINWEELYAPEIHYLRLCYYDGYSWWDNWHVIGENPLPQMVQVTIGFADHPPLDEDLGQDEVNEEFCECLNREPPDCLPLARDEHMTVVKLAQADPLFRSRMSREGQAMLEELAKPEEDEEEPQP